MEQFVVVFSTKEEADILQERDYQHFISLSNDINYDRITTAWDIPKQKANGDWTYFTYPPADYTGYTLEAYDEANYPMGE